jgi:Cu/Ag efflux protein CusF
MKNGRIRGVAAAVVAAVVLSSACTAHANDNKLEKKAAKEGEQYYDGVISAVDFKANTVTVKKENAGTMTFTSGANAKFYARQKKEGAALTDFKVGDKVEVWYVVDNGTPTLHTLGEKGARAEHKEKKAEKGK